MLVGSSGCGWHSGNGGSQLGVVFALPAPWNVRQYCDFWLSQSGLLVARDVAINALQHAGPLAVTCLV